VPVFALDLNDIFAYPADFKITWLASIIIFAWDTQSLARAPRRIIVKID
jgi:hypothetical protein